MVTDSQTAQIDGWDTTFLPMWLIDATIPNREEIFLRRELRVSENDADYPILKRMLKVIMGEGD